MKGDRSNQDCIFINNLLFRNLLINNVKIRSAHFFLITLLNKYLQSQPQFVVSSQPFLFIAVHVNMQPKLTCLCAHEWMYVYISICRRSTECHVLLPAAPSPAIQQGEEQWKKLCLVLIGILSVLCVLILVYVVISHIRARAHHRMQKTFMINGEWVIKTTIKCLFTDLHWFSASFLMVFFDGKVLNV